MLTCLIVNAVSAVAQISVDRTLNWSDAPRSFSAEGAKEVFSLQFTGASYTTEGEVVLPLFAESFPASGNKIVSAKISNAQYAPIETANAKIAAGMRTKISNEIKINAGIGYARKKPEANISFIPLRINPSTGNIEKLVSFTLDIVTANDQQLKITGEDDFTGNSVLSSGSWYKFAIKREGVFKVDRAVLNDMGISGTVSFSTFGVFGNGGGMLPESNLTARYDDLQENAIYKYDANGNGMFEDGDYILFYGQAPHRWYYNTVTNTFKHKNNIYSDQTCYFITTDRGNAKYITAQASVAGENYNTSSYDIMSFIDQDKVNLLNSGRAWYGDIIDIYTPNRTYNFTLPDLITSEYILFRASAAGNSTSGSITIDLKANGASLPLDITISEVSEGFSETYAYENGVETGFNSTSSSIAISMDYYGSSVATAWVNYIELIGRANIVYNNTPLFFRDARTIGDGRITKFTIDAPNGIQIWDITDRINAKLQNYTVSGSDLTFTLATDTLKEFVAVDPNDAYGADDITFIEKVVAQDLHNDANQPDLVIVSHPSFMSEARRLAGWHHDVDGLDTLVVDVNKVYNEFSSGVQDISAIRDMMRMFYERAGGDESLMPQYLLLFGDASFDYRFLAFDEEKNTLKIPCFESNESLARAVSYGTDDYYGFLDPTEGDNIEDINEKLDVGIGRLPVMTVDEATIMVDKIMHYKSPESLGSWRNALTFLADDEDYNTHVEDAEELAEYMTTNYPVYNVDKIFFDSYQQIPGAGGERYPEVETAIDNKIFTGSFIMNYLGHGNEQNWAQERVLSVDDINSWDNYDKLPLFITATCSFSRYDNPDLRSAGELVLLNPQGGGIALVTTVRLVIASANYDLNSNLIEHLFEPVDGEYPRLGDAVRLGKNGVTASAQNNRKFILLGDPALQLNYPHQRVVTKTVNGFDVAVYTDTLKALEKVTITGEVTDESGVKLTGFNGVVYPAIYDKPILINNLVNDPTFSGVGGYGPSEPFSFYLQKNALYKGKASVVNGEFTFTFIVPKDISYTYGNGKLSYYADNGTDDANGYNTNVIIGGSSDDAAADNVGPDVDVFMNDESFVFGGLTDENPVLLIKLIDSSGINALGNAIGHDITATLDDDQQTMLKLNEYYEADLDKYQSGSVLYPLNDIAEGRHTVTVKAWDVYNNSGDGYTEFVVAETADLALDHVLNYPNPFTDNTSFWFEHNRPGDVLDVKIEIFTVSGKRVKTIQQQVITDGYRVDDITWDGLDDYGDVIGKGVYVYKLSVKAASDNSKASEFQKLVILK